MLPRSINNGWTMSFDSPSVLQHLQDLQRHIAIAPPLGAWLVAAVDRRPAHDHQDAICENVDFRRSVIAMAAIAARVKTHIVPADGLGVAVHSLAELGQRAKRWIALTELSKLRHLNARRHYSYKGRAPDLGWEPFCGLEDLTTFLRNELARITNEWIRYRNSTGMEGEAYWAALHDADASMRTLGDASDLATFLLRAKTFQRRPAMQAACARLSEALALRIDIGPDVLLQIAGYPIHQPATEAAP